MTRVGLIGCGMWGRNLARNLAQLGVLAGVADAVPAQADSFAAEFETEAMAVPTLLEQAELDGIVIATAAPTPAPALNSVTPDPVAKQPAQEAPTNAAAAPAAGTTARPCRCRSGASIMTERRFFTASDSGTAATDMRGVCTSSCLAVPSVQWAPNA